jgi:hypothetical protein
MKHTLNTTDTDGTERTNAGAEFMNLVRGFGDPAAAVISRARDGRGVANA